MTNAMQPDLGSGSSAETSIAQRLASIVWAVFFVWVGVALLANVPWDWFFLGVGVLILIAQLARWRLNLGIEWFWIACGAVFLAGGIWTLLNLPWPLAPMLLILLGVALFAKTVVGIVR